MARNSTRIGVTHGAQAPAIPSRPVAREYVQLEPARGRAAAAADRRAHAARRARGELLVPAPPGRLRVDRGAGRRQARGRHGLRRGLRLERARPAPRRASSASTPTRRPTSTPACATCGPTCASSATWSRASPSPATRSSSCRRSSTSRTPARSSSTSSRCWRPGGVAYVSTPNLLTLAPPGAEKSDNPWHVREYRAAEFRAALRGRTSRRSRCSASSTPASCAPTSWRSSSAGTASTRRLRLTKPFYDRFTPAIAASDFELKEGDLDRALDFLAVCHAA